MSTSPSSERTPSASALERAKRPRTILAGPYGHPFHPIAVTIPIGAWVASFVFDLAAAFGEDAEAFATGAYWLIVIGCIGAAVAALVGLLDLSVIPRGTRAFRTALLHMTLNVAVLALFVVNLVLRGAQGTDAASGAGIALSVVALAMLGVSGWLGGQLAYRHGVRVADERTQAEAYR